MDLKVFFSSFGLILLAELGDKTQLAALTIAAESGKPWSVFVGASLALVLLTFLASLLGAGVAHVVPREIITKVAGAGFIIIGFLVFFGKL
jgi:putative Ca2+/H+ antiporter (TMEM165/GDT1 family)